MTRRTALKLGLVATAGTLMAQRSASALGTVPIGMTRRTMPSGRTYLVRSRAATTAGAVVIGLHGTASNAQHCNDQFAVTGSLATSGWVHHAAASANDYTLVLGEAPSGTWNVGGGWPSAGANDDQYLLDVVADVKARQTNVDPAQVFIAGFSAGGAMAWRAAALHPDVFAACGSASGWAPLYPTTPIDCWHHHGTADITVPIRGGSGTKGYNFPGAHMEAQNATRDSRCVLYASNSGHSVPGWMAAQLWSFWTVNRHRP